MDWELVQSCYHPDGLDHHDGFSGTATEFIAWIQPILAGLESTTHFVGNQLVEITGDTAWAEHYTQSINRRRRADGVAFDTFVNMRYLDRLERRNGDWRIKDRRMTIDSERVDQLVSEPRSQTDLPLSRRDRTDPSYAR